MRNRATLFFHGLLLATVVIAGASMLPASAAAQEACPPTINACGCTITTPGSYKIGMAINSTQGLTPRGACIELASSFVILDGAKSTITGPGGDSPTGIGIWVRRGVHTDFLEGRGTVISGWDVGLLIEGSDIFADDFTANTNGTAGVELNKAQGIELSQLRNMGEAIVFQQHYQFQDADQRQHWSVRGMLGPWADQRRMPGSRPVTRQLRFHRKHRREYQLWCRARQRHQQLDCDQPDAGRGQAQFEGRSLRREFELRRQQMVWR